MKAHSMLELHILHRVTEFMAPALCCFLRLSLFRAFDLPGHYLPPSTIASIHRQCEDLHPLHHGSIRIAFAMLVVPEPGKCLCATFVRSCSEKPRHLGARSPAVSLRSSPFVSLSLFVSIHLSPGWLSLVLFWSQNAPNSNGPTRT